MSDSDLEREDHRDDRGAGAYASLAIALASSLVIMYLLTMAFVAVPDDYLLNLSNFYMALIMVFPMGIIMLIVMWRMFPNRVLNIVLMVVFAALAVAALLLGRGGILIGNQQFLQSMIPHHSRAILMCNESQITDPEIVGLCDSIIESQQDEIDQMNEIRERLGG